MSMSTAISIEPFIHYCTEGPPQAVSKWMVQSNDLKCPECGCMMAEVSDLIAHIYSELVMD